MPNFYDVLLSLPDRSKQSILAIVIASLSNFPIAEMDKNIHQKLTSELKILFENHDANLDALIFRIKQTINENKKLISANFWQYLNEIITTLSNNTIRESFSHTNLNYINQNLELSFNRYFESNIAIKILLSPSENLWRVVDKVSQQLIYLLSSNQSENEHIQYFLKGLGSKNKFDLYYFPFAFGRYPNTPSLEEVINTLKEKIDLTRIMLIHFMFIRNAYQLIPTDIDFFSQIKHYFPYGDVNVYAEHMRNYNDLVDFFVNYVKRCPHLYTDRGRLSVKDIPTKSLGLLLNKEDRSRFPTRDTNWAPDCLSTTPNLNSPYVQSLIHKGIPYISGPSGMTSLLCGVMVCIGKLTDDQEQRYYILAIMAYIVSGGLHSIHEVLTIPKYRLGLLSRYHIEGENMGNYHAFFSYFEHDATITNHISDSWNSLISMLSENFPVSINEDYVTSTTTIISSAGKNTDERACCSIQ